MYALMIPADMCSTAQYKPVIDRVIYQDREYTIEEFKVVLQDLNYPTDWD